MTFADQRDEASRLADRQPEDPERGDAHPSRRRRIWLAVAALVAIAVAAASWFLHQAVSYQRIQRDLDLAAGAYAAARAANARELAPADWQLAAGRIDDAMAELHRQDGRFVLVRTYPRVHEMLAKAIEAADAAKATAESARAAAEANRQPGAGIESPRSWGGSGFVADKDQAKSAVDAAKASFSDALSLFASLERCSRAHRAKEVVRYLQTIKGNLDTLKASVTDIDRKYSFGDFSGSRAAAETLKGQLDSLVKDLSGIATKFKCK
jgi:hypothetical protein